MSLTVGGWSADVAIDHVLVVCFDAARAADKLLAATGLASIDGGVHTGLGTRNRIVPLGVGYLELVEVHDLALAQGNDFGRLVLAGLASAHNAGREECLFAWSAAVPDVTAVASREGLPVMRLGRAGVSVTLCGVAESVEEPARPFLLERGSGDRPPGGLEAPHVVAPTGIRAMSAACASEPEWLGDVPLGDTAFTLVAGQPRLLSVEVACADAEPIVLTYAHPTGRP